MNAKPNFCLLIDELLMSWLIDRDNNSDPVRKRRIDARANLEAAISQLAMPTQPPANTASPAQGDAGQWQVNAHKEWTAAPPEGILHHALRDQMARDAAEGLKAIEAQQAKRDRRLAEEQRREDDRRNNGIEQMAANAWRVNGDDMCSTDGIYWKPATIKDMENISLYRVSAEGGYFNVGIKFGDDPVIDIRPARSDDMNQVADAERSASAMQPQRKEFLG